MSPSQRDESDPAAETPPPQPGRRERKKEATRRAIIDAGFRLFGTKGFSGTTVAEIAEEADVSEGTLYSHFRGGKEELLYYPLQIRVGMLVDRLEQRDSAETTLEAFEDWLRRAPDPDFEFAAQLKVARQAIRTEIPLAGTMIERVRAVAHDAVAESYAREFAVPVDSFQTRLMTAFTLELSRDWARLWREEDATTEEHDAYLGLAFTGLRAAQKALFH
jgi:AcrR family transcriptional regulator